MSGNEAAVTGHLLHVASKALVSYAVEVGAQRIVCEDLSNVRDAALKKGKDLRSKVHRWPYAKGQFFIAYKAAAAGIGFELVDPRNTSRGCPRCGYVSASNRKGLRFKCGQCGHQDDSDRNASKNIRLRSVLASQCVDRTGSPKSPEICNPLIPDLECSVIRHSGFGVGLG
jgi:IS605 OrfB family transposase